MIVEETVAQWMAAEVGAWLNAPVRGDGSAAFGAATTDSRETREGTAFFALDGAKHRGSEFVPDAFGSGCSVVVVPSDWAGDIPPGRAAILVPDPEEALARLAARVRAGWTGPVIAITGSVGKTTVKEMVAHVLEEEGHVLCSPGNFNTVVGLARTLLGSAGEEPDHAVLEVGASEPGEVARLADIVRPTAAAITNVSASHLSGFGGLDGVRREKLELLRAVSTDGIRVVDGDDSALVEAALEVGPVVRVGFDAGNDLRATDIDVRSDGTAFRLEDGTQGRLFVPGTHQVRNALFALALTAPCGVTSATALERLRTFASVAGRLVLRERNGITVADDTYNANPASMDAALRWFATHGVSGRKAVALADMLELGADSRRLHEELGDRVADLAPDLAVFAGNESRAASEVCHRRIGDRCRWTESPEEAAQILRDWAQSGDAVLVKGSRGMRMERVVTALVGKADADAG